MSETFSQFMRLIRENQVFAIIVITAFVLTMFFSLAVIFYKIRQKPWKALIPIYNHMVLMDILDIPIWMFLTIVIPFVNIIGIPFMVGLVGWKLGTHCRKGIFMKLGLILCPPLFFPLLAASFIDIDGTGRYVMEPVKLPTNFSLEAVEVDNLEIDLNAMSLGNAEIIESIAPIMATRKIEPPKVPTVKRKEFNEVEATSSANEVEDLKRVLPTADDLTFDYNSLYQGQEKPVEEKVEVPEKKEEPKSDFEVKGSETDESTVNYDELYKDVVSENPKSETSSESENQEVELEPVEEEPKIIIHEVALEAAEPVDGISGPIPINKRYDFQSQKQDRNDKEVAAIHDIELKENVESENTVEPVIEETITEEVIETKIEEEKGEENGLPNPFEIPKVDIAEDSLEDSGINPMAPPVINPILPNESVSNVAENVPVEETVQVSTPTEVVQQTVEPVPEVQPSIIEQPQVVNQQAIVEPTPVVEPQPVVQPIPEIQPQPSVIETPTLQQQQVTQAPIPEMVPTSPVVETPNVIQPSVIQPVPEITPVVAEVQPSIVEQPQVPEQMVSTPMEQSVATPNVVNDQPQVAEQQVIEPTPVVESQPVVQSVPEVQSQPNVAPPVESSDIGDLPMQAASPFGADGMPGLADVPDLSLPNVNAVQEVEVPEIDLTEQAMQGMRERKTIEPGTRVDQIVSMNIAEPDQLPVGMLVKPPQPAPVVEQPAPVMPQPVQPEMTRAEAMGIKQNFFTGVVPNTPPVPNNFNQPMMNQPGMNNPMMQPNSMAPQINNRMPQQGMNHPMMNGNGPIMQVPPMNQVPMNNGPMPGMMNQSGMNNQMMKPDLMAPQMNNRMPQQGMNQPMMNGNGMNAMNNPTSIFQVNSPNGAPLLRPLDNTPTPSAEKICPVCGVKLKADCPICIMCGFKF